MPQLMGFSHIDLTVSDRERTAVWWQEMVGFKLVNQGRIEAHEFRSMVHPSGLAVTVLTHDGTAKATPSKNSASASITWHSESRIKTNYSDGSHISMRWVSLIRESSTSVSVPLWSSDIQTTSNSSSTSTQTISSRGSEGASVRNMYAYAGVSVYRHARSR
jgi:hypothetical protein